MNNNRLSFKQHCNVL